MWNLALRFAIDEVPNWASQYSYASDYHIENEIAPRARARGYLTRADFLAICEWKSQRQRSRYARNAAAIVEEATRIAMSARDERVRIGVLRVLEGVGWPVASTILHFTHREPYPILDFRALWSLGIEQQPAYYVFSMWWEYVATCRRLADQAGVSVRELDRALWQYSKENQGLDTALGIHGA